MTVALSLGAILVAFAFIWRGHDVRIVLLSAALAIGSLAGSPGVVFRKTAETLADGRFLLPICSAMGFAYVVRVTGCVDAMVELLLRPIAGARRVVVPGGSFVALVVNVAIPSQTSALASVGPLLVALMARLETSAADAGTALVFGASIAGAVLNPGVAEIATVAAATGRSPATIVVPLAPAVLAAFLVGIGVLLVRRRFGPPRTHEPLHSASVTTAESATHESPPTSTWRLAYKALLPPLPVFVLLLSHPSLPSCALVQRALPRGLEVFTVMLVGSAIAIAVATRERTKATRAMLEGMGYAFAHVVTIIAVSAGTAKALELAGVLNAFVDLTAGHEVAAFTSAFLIAFGLGIVSGSGTATSVALVTTIAPRVAELGVNPFALFAVILFGAEAGRTTSPVAAVLLFGGELVSVQPRTLSLRLALPCLAGGAAGALYCATQLR